MKQPTMLCCRSFLATGRGVHERGLCCVMGFQDGARELKVRAKQNRFDEFAGFEVAQDTWFGHGTVRETGVGFL